MTVWSLLGAGLSTAAAPSLARTLEVLGQRNTLFARMPSFVGSDHSAQLCAFRDPGLGQPVADRFAKLLEEALDDLLHNGSGPVALSRMIVCLPQADPVDGTAFAASPDFGDGLVARCLDRLDAVGLMRPDSVVVSRLGPTAAVETLADGNLEGSTGAVLLLAVDSHACRDRLSRLLNQGRLFSKATPFGLVPGEAAGALLLAKTGALPALSGLATTTEPDDEPSGRDSVFTAQSDCLLSSIAHLTQPLAGLSSDWSNSRYRAAEISYSAHRLPPHALRPDFLIDHPSTRLGDIGAAFMLASTILSIVGPRRPDGPVLHATGAFRSGLRASWVTETGEPGSTELDLSRF